MSFSDDLAASQSGDPIAQARLFEPYQPVLWLLARKVLGPRVSVRVSPSDVLAQALPQAVQAGSVLWPISCGTGEMAANHRDAVRGKVRDFHHRVRRDVARDEGLPDLDLPGRVTEPVEAIIQEEQQEQLVRALELLTEEEREVVVRCLIDRQKLTDIAGDLDCATRTVKRRLTRALHHLKELIGPQGGDG